MIVAYVLSRVYTHRKRKKRKRWSKIVKNKQVEGKGIIHVKEKDGKSFWYLIMAGKEEIPLEEKMQC